MSINVTITDATNVSVAVGGSLATSPLTALQVTAGANITITTTSGVYTFIGPSVPVQSVNGQTGTVVLNLANLTAAAASHTHVMANITDLAFPVNTVNGKTGTVVLTSTDVSAASAAHTHVAANITNLTSVANVVSVNGQTGVAVLNSTNVSAASAVHTHVMANITDLAFPVSSVNGKTGTVSLTITDLTAAAASHTHVAANITNLTSVANVVSVNGITGTPSIVAGSGVTISTAGSSITIEAAGSTAGGAGLSDALPQSLGSPTAGTSGLASRSDHAHAMPSAADVGAAAIGHTHAMANITDLAFPVSSVNGKAGTVSLTITDLTAAAASHSHVASDITDLTSFANVVSVNGQTGVVTVTGGVTAASVITKSLSTSQNNYDAGSSDIVRLSPSANVILTGLAGGSNGVVRVLYNVSTHAVTLSSDNTNSVATNRFSIVSGSSTLSAGDSATVWYDGTSQRWRVLEDQSPGGGGSGSELGSATPQNLGFAFPGASGFASREDHVHAMPSAADVGAASAVHTHVAADITNFTSVANVVSVNGMTGAVTISAGATAAVVATKSPSSSQNNNYDAGPSDIVRLNPPQDIVLTGLANGQDGVVRVLYNVSTHVVTLTHDNAASVSTNRFTIVSGDAMLEGGDSATVWYDGTSQRWRVLEDRVPDSTASGGGVGMSYLFG